MQNKANSQRQKSEDRIQKTGEEKLYKWLYNKEIRMLFFRRILVKTLSILPGIDLKTKPIQSQFAKNQNECKLKFYNELWEKVSLLAPGKQSQTKPISKPRHRSVD